MRRTFEGEITDKESQAARNTGGWHSKHTQQAANVQWQQAPTCCSKAYAAHQINVAEG